MVNCVLCYIIGQCLMFYRRHQKCMNRVSSVASLTLAFFIIQYFLINKGISVTSDIKKNKNCPASLTTGLKCLLQGTDMHEIDYTFLFLSFFPPKVIWGGGGEGMHCTNLVCTVYIYNYTCQGEICFLLSKVNNQSHLISNLSHMLCGHHNKYKRI